MKRLLALLLCAGFLISAAQVANIHLPIETFKLDNGLRVVLSEDHTLPVVAVYVVYDVGARAEAKGRTGFAHLFEHMMFEGSAHVKKGEHMQYVESNGGSFNGSTHPDYTDYFEQLPSNKLAVALWLESDRMRSLAITPENLANQKEAVKQERRLSFDNRPYATAIVDRWPLLAYHNWQSSHSLIGSFENLNAATIDDVSQFFKTYYAPNNAVLSVVGDVKPVELKKLVEQYFGDIPSQPVPARPDLTESGAVNTVTETYKDPLAQVPGVVIGYRGPQRGTPDYYSMILLDMILTGGESSRLQRDLVKGKKSIVQYQANLGWPFAGPDDYKDPAEYATFVLFKPNIPATEIVDQYQNEVADIQKAGVPAAELDRERTFLIATTLRELETCLGRARILGTFELLDGKPEEINKLLDRYAAVTPEDVQDVAKKYFRPEDRSVLVIQPEPHSVSSPAASPKGGN